MCPGAPSSAFNRPYGYLDVLVGSNIFGLHPKPLDNLGLSERGTVKYTDGHLEVVWLVKGTHPKFQAGRDKPVMRNKVLNIK